MKKLSLKQKFFILLSILIFVFSTGISAYYGLTNSKIEAISNVFKLRPFTSIYYQGNSNQPQIQKFALGEEYSKEATQLINLGYIDLITPYKTTLTGIETYDIKITEFTGYFNTTSEVKLTLNDFEITVSPAVEGFIDTSESKIYILSGLLEYKSEILEANNVIDYKNGIAGEYNREILKETKFSNIVVAMNKLDSKAEQIDLTAPELLSINLENLTQTTESIITITAEAKDAARIFVNGLEVTEKSGQKFSLRQSLRIGDNFIDIRLIDEAGNIFEKRYVVTRVIEQEPISFPE